MTSYSIEAAAAQICGDSFKDPVRWLRRRIHTGEIRAYKLGNTWRLREGDINDFIERSSNHPVHRVMPSQDWERAAKLTAGSLNRRRTS